MDHLTRIRGGYVAYQMISFHIAKPPDLIMEENVLRCRHTRMNLFYINHLSESVVCKTGRRVLEKPTGLQKAKYNGSYVKYFKSSFVFK